MLTDVQQHLLRLFLEQGRDYAIILLDPEGLVIGWLAASETVFGYTAEEIIGQRLDVLFTPEDRGRGVAEQELAIAAALGRSEDDRWQVQ